MLTLAIILKDDDMKKMIIEVEAEDEKTLKEYYYQMCVRLEDFGLATDYSIEDM
jgi:hypothetical protein